MIPVTKPFLPPRKEFDSYLDQVWKRNWLTNEGPLSIELEAKLKEYTEINDLLLTSSGTFGLQLAIKALGLSGEILTTAFSYVATTSSIVWEGLKPVFVDIDPHTLNIDPDKIEQHITNHTSAILATHVFGNPCNLDRIETIAQKHNLKVIYDAAHSFGTTYKNKSIYSFGDISITSFHATKLFHCTEGGAIFSKNPDFIKKAYFMRNFGHHGEGNFKGVGINGKNSEFHSAMGLANFPFIKIILDSRQSQYLNYRRLLLNTTISFQTLIPNAIHNYAYFPVIIDSEKQTLELQKKLNENDIFPRRYFYPSLNTLQYLEYQSCKVSEDIAPRILCLPMFVGLTEYDQEKICAIIKSTLQ
ncbi:MAG: DegT/DnrJ/EryC1/StrS family aminotransferase [Reichenbachiella sp.]